jgi:hypothetical protein
VVPHVLIVGEEKLGGGMNRWTRLLRINVELSRLGNLEMAQELSMTQQSAQPDVQFTMPAIRQRKKSTIK